MKSCREEKKKKKLRNCDSLGGIAKESSQGFSSAPPSPSSLLFGETFPFDIIMHSANFFTEILDRKENFYMKLEVGGEREKEWNEFGIQVVGGDNQQKKLKKKKHFYLQLKWLLESPMVSIGSTITAHITQKPNET